MRNATFANKTKARIEAMSDVALLAEYQPNVSLAKTCLKANISPSSIALVMRVTRASVHGWLNNKKINRNHAIGVMEMVKILNADLERGVLPKFSKLDRQEYEQRLFTALNEVPTSRDERVSALGLNNPNLERYLLGAK